MEIRFPPNKVIKINDRKLVECPTCQKNASESHYPFCSVKCSNIDLKKWLSDEGYIKDNDGNK